MRINLDKLKELANKKITIDGAYAGFIGTDLENDDFSVTVKNVSRIDNINLIGALRNGVEDIQEGVLALAIFKASIVEVDGFYNENDEELSFDDTVDYLFNYAPKELNNAIDKAIDSFRKIEDEKKSETEPSIEDMQNGMHNTEITA